MKLPSSHRLALAVAIALASSVCASSSPAQQAGKNKSVQKECAAAYVDAQTSRKQGALLAAREKLITCGHDECASALKNECAQWLTEVNASIPTIVVVAKDPNGNETLAVKVFDGDTLIKDGLDAKAIELDPGTHRLRLELEGRDPIEREIVLQEGRKNQIVEVSWRRESAPSAPTPAPAPAPEPAPATTDKPGPPVLAYALAGVGVVALAGTTYFWLTAASEKSDLDECKPGCAQEDVDSVERKRLYGDIALGAGVVALGAATYLFLNRPQAAPAAESARAVRLDVHPGPAGAFATLSGRF